MAKTLFCAKDGFTLVEIAIVMIIIGLLIGGILKGQAIVENARVTNVVTQVKAIEAAVYTFQDKYNQKPGDMPTATIALPGCDAAHLCLNGNGSGYIADDPRSNGGAHGWMALLRADGASDGESLQFWKHLALTGIMTGVDAMGNINNPAWGKTHPASPFGGGYEFFYDALMATGGGGAAQSSGHILRLSSNGALLDTAAGTVSGVLTPQQGFQIDTKMDDGDPQGGSVLANYGQGPGVGRCKVTNAAGVAVYDEANAVIDVRGCLLYFRLLNK